MEENEYANGNPVNRSGWIKLIKFFVLLFLLMNIVSKAIGQNVFQRSNSGHHTQPAAGGGYYCMGGSIYQVSLGKMDNNGNSVWIKDYDFGGSNIFSYGLAATKDSGAALVGTTYNGIDFYPYIIKANKVGIVDYVKLYGSGAFYDVKQKKENGLIACGYSMKKGYVVNTDESGNIIWANTYDTSILYSISQCNDSSFITSGMIRDNMYILKLSKTGTVQWSKELDFPGQDNGQCVAEDKDGGFIISGQAGFTGASPQRSKGCIIKLSKNGSIVWSRLLNDLNIGEAQQFASTNYVSVANDNSYILLNYSLVNFQETNSLIKISPSLKINWAKDYAHGCSGNTNFSGTVFALPDNTYLLSKWNAYTYKVDSSGNSGCVNKPAYFSLTDSIPWIYNLSTIPMSSNAVYNTTVNETTTTHPYNNHLITIDSIKIVPDGKTSFCFGKDVVLRAQVKTSNSSNAGYKWSNGENQSEILADQTARYTLRATSLSHCIRDTFIEITEIPLPPASITVNGSTTFCSGDSVMLSAPEGNYSYQWWPGGSRITKTIAAKTQGLYSVAVTNNVTGCQSISTYAESVNVTVNQTPAPFITKSGPTGFCSGDSVVLTAEPNYNYLWSNGKTTRSITVKTSGTYSSEVSGSNGCKIKSDSVVVKVTTNAAAEITITAENDTACTGIQHKFSASAMFQGNNPTYEWRINNVSQGAGFQDAEFALNDGDVVDCILTSNLACAVITKDTSNKISIKVIDKPATPGVITGDASICGSLTKEYSITSVNNASSYFWEVPTGSTIKEGQGTTTIKVLIGTTSGQIRVSTDNICGRNMAQFKNISINNLPSNPSGINGSDTVCANSFAKFYSALSVSNADSYVWTIPPEATITDGSGTGTLVLTFGTKSGIISVKAVNSCGSTTTFSKNITVINPPVISGEILGLNSVCQNTNNLQYSIYPSDNHTYNWGISGGGTISSANGNDTAKISFLNSDATISLTASNSCGTSNAISKSIKVILIPSMPQEIIGNTNICEKSKSYLKAKSTETKTFLWTLPQGYTLQSGQGTDSLCFSPGSSKDTILVNAINTCGKSMEYTVPINVKKLPKAVGFLNGITEVCENSQQNYSASFIDATAFQWIVPSSMKIIGSNNSNSLLVNAGKLNGKIQIIASNNCGNSDTMWTSLSIDPNPSKPAITINSTELTSTASTEYQWFKNGIVIQNGKNQTYTAITDGYYQVKVSDAKGCSSISDSVNVSLSDIEKISDNINFKLYPNPVKDIITLELPDYEQFKITIIRINGEIVKSIKTESNKNIQIDASGLLPGMYFMIVRNKNWLSEKSFIKE